jgi:hypothetical protein
MYVCTYLLFDSTGLWTQRPTFVRQVFLPLETCHQPFFLFFSFPFLGRVLCFSQSRPQTVILLPRASHVARVTGVHCHDQLIGWNETESPMFCPQNCHSPVLCLLNSLDYWFFTWMQQKCMEMSILLYTHTNSRFIEEERSLKFVENVDYLLHILNSIASYM